MSLSFPKVEHLLPQTGASHVARAFLPACLHTQNQHRQVPRAPTVPRDLSCVWLQNVELFLRES